MILLFLGNWRHTLVIAISIPLSILASICTLSALGETINIMTLGGLALAVGILVDDATVDDRKHRPQPGRWGKDVTTAILDGAAQIALPALVSTLCICIVFLPMFFLAGVARYLFVPLAEAVVFAMLASYILSRTHRADAGACTSRAGDEHAARPRRGATRVLRAVPGGVRAAGSRGSATGTRVGWRARWRCAGRSCSGSWRSACFRRGCC